MSDWDPGPAWLFCPADRPDRYQKALTRADTVVVDLEDAIAPGDRAISRDRLRELSAQGLLDRQRTILRVNGVGTLDHDRDLQLAAEVEIPRIMLAKAEQPDRIASIQHEVIPLIETPRGVEWARELAEPGNVVGLMWGADDLVAGLGGVSSRGSDGQFRGVINFARARMLVAAKAFDRLAVDAVHMDIADIAGLAAACEDAVAVGFDATVAIHPTQVPTIRAAYLPSSGQVTWARRLLAHVGTDRGVTTFEGVMVDGPIFKQAERILQLHSGRQSSVSK